MYAIGSMITNVHKSRCRQYSKAGLDGKITQNGLWGYQCNGKSDMSNTEVMLPSFAMMRGGVLDVDIEKMETRP